MDRKLDPIDETVAAVQTLGRIGGDPALLVALEQHSIQVRHVVPDCIGMSLAMVDRETDVVFTLVASDYRVALLDAAQYLDGGPCVDGVYLDDRLQYHDGDPLDERAWHDFARASARAGVLSTLTLPIVADDAVVGSVNLYASALDAFDGHHEEVARIFGTWPTDAITNADLSFSTFHRAEATPKLLKEQADIDLATDTLAELLEVGVEAARRHLAAVAVRAGISEVEVARMIQELYDERHGPSDGPLL